MKELFIVTAMALTGVWLAAAGGPALLLVVVLGGGFVWLLASAGNTSPPTPKQKTSATGCPFLDNLP